MSHVVKNCSWSTMALSVICRVSVSQLRQKRCDGSVCVTFTGSSESTWPVPAWQAYHDSRTSLCRPQLLRNLAEAANLKSKIKSLFAGEHLNITEDRAVLHPALRAPRDEVCPTALHFGSRSCSAVAQNTSLPLLLLSDK